MTILSWDKPERKMPVEQWKKISADGAPPGVYSPNMSDEDRMKWKAKIVGKRKGIPQVEIRRNGLVLIVCLDKGYNYKTYRVHPQYGRGTKGINIHLATNGPQQLTFEEMDQMHQAVQEAKQTLMDLEE